MTWVVPALPLAVSSLSSFVNPFPSGQEFYILTQVLSIVDPSTPRDGTRRNPFQQDSTRFKGDAAATCGETLGGGDNSVESGVKAVMSNMGNTLPQVSAGGELTMTVHQVNGDGAGPYTCMIDSTGTGAQWDAIQVTTNVPGNNGRSQAKAEDFVSLNSLSLSLLTKP